MECWNNSSKREVYNNAVLPQEGEGKKKKPQINNLALHLKQLENEEQTKSKRSRRKEVL